MWTAYVFKRITIYQLASVAVASLLSLWLWPTSGLGVLVGGGFAFGNFLLLRFVVARTLEKAGSRRLVYGLMLALKTVVALAVIAVLLLVAKLPPLAFCLGLAVAFVGMLLALADAALSRRAPSV